MTTANYDDSSNNDEKLFITHTRVHADGSVYVQTTLDGLLHASPLGDPSEAIYDKNGLPRRQIWHAFGEEHRIGGPARILFFRDSTQKQTETFLIQGKPRPHSHGPFRVRWDQDGSVWEEEFADETPGNLKPPPVGLAP